MNKPRVCAHGCGARFSCEENCNHSDRICWCVGCIFKKIEEGIRINQPFHIVGIQDRFKCPLLTEEQKRKLMLYLITNKVVNEEGDI